MTKQQLQKNIYVYYGSSFFRGMLVTIPIWVSFYQGILTLQQVTILQSIQYGLAMFLELPTGAFADLFGRKASNGIGFLLFGFGSFMTGFSTQAWQVFVFILIAALGRVFLSGSMTAWLYDSLKERKQQKKFAEIRVHGNTSFQIAMVISMLIGGYSYAIWRGLPYIIEGTAMFVGALLTFVFATEPRIDSEKFTLSSYFQQTKQGTLELFKNKFIALFSLYYVIVAGAVNSVQKVFNQMYAEEIGFNEVQRGWLFSVIRIINIGILVFFVRSQHFSRAKSIFLFPVLIAISFLPTLIASQWLAVILFIGLTLGNTTRMTILNQFMNDEFLSKTRATALSSLEMFSGISYMLVVFVSGFFLDNFGVGNTIFVVGCTSLVFLLPLSVWLVQYKSKESLFQKIKRNMQTLSFKKSLAKDKIMLKKEF